jgi:hypothetical protein
MTHAYQQFKEHVGELHQFAEEHHLHPAARQQLYGLAQAFLVYGGECYREQLATTQLNLPFLIDDEVIHSFESTMTSLRSRGAHHLATARNDLANLEARLPEESPSQLPLFR